jgi:hypothetical protein
MKNKQKYNSVRTIPKSDIEIVRKKESKIDFLYNPTIFQMEEIIITIVLVVEIMMIIVYVAS